MKRSRRDECLAVGPFGVLAVLVGLFVSVPVSANGEDADDGFVTVRLTARGTVGGHGAPCVEGCRCYTGGVGWLYSHGADRPLAREWRDSMSAMSDPGQRPPRGHVGGRRRVGLVVVFGVVASVMWVGVPQAGAVSEAGFSDLDGARGHRSAVESLAGEGVFEGTECGPGGFCPGDAVQRWVMAVWLVRILDGADPGAVSSSRFVDVDADVWWAPYVERLADLGVTAGCSTEPVRFCPTGSVTRARMASFLVRAFGLPPASPAGFVDVSGGAHAGNIDALAASGVTAGCRTDPLAYCPDRDTTRAQMATFLTRALALDPGPQTVVRVLYAVPSDGEFRTGTPYAIRQSVAHVRWWYQQQLGGATFSLSYPTVENCPMSRPESFYATGNAWEKIVDGVQHCAPVQGWTDTTVWVIYPDVEEACDEDHELGAGGPGLTILGSTDVEGVTEPGEYRYCDEVWWGSLGRWIGGLAHELGHALGLPHPPGCDDELPTCDRQALMSNGYESYPGAYLRDDEKAILGRSPFVKHHSPLPEPALIPGFSKIRGTMVGPGGEPLGGIGVWAWQNDVNDSGFALTGPDGTFVIWVPDGSFTLYVYAAPEGNCVGRYDGEGITISDSEAVLITVEGQAITGIRIRLPALPEDLPAAEC